MAQMVLGAKLDGARSYWRGLRAAAGLLWSLSVIVLLVLVSFHLDRLLVFSIETRALVWVVLGAAFLVLSGLLVVRRLVEPRSPEQIAAMVERSFPHLGERLLSAVEFSRADPEFLAGTSPALLQDLQRDAEAQVAELNFRAAFEPTPFIRSGWALIACLGIFLLHALLFGPALSAFWSRMLLGNTPVWRDTRVQVDPLRSKVLKGTDFTLGVRQEGKRVRSGSLHFQFGDGPWGQVRLSATAAGGFTHRFPGMTEPVRYYATAGDGISDWGSVEVVDPATVIGAKLALTFPAYLDRAPIVRTAQSGGIAAPVGTHVRVELQSSKPLNSALVAVGSAKPVAWETRDRQINGEIVVRGLGQYTVRLTDQDGFLAPDSQAFPIKAISDQAPEVQLHHPDGDIDVVPDARVRLTILARDDNGVDKVSVPFAIEGRKPQSLQAGAGGRREKQLRLESEWSLAGLKLRPGDTVRYHVEATDFDTLSGPHVGKSGEQQLRIIDRGEAERRYEEQRNEILQQLGDLIREQKAARGDVETQRRAARPNPEAIASAEERQRAAANTASDLSRRISDLARVGEMNNLASEREIEGQRSAQNALQQLAQNGMPQAANRIGSAQSQAQSNPRAAQADLAQASSQQQQVAEELQRIAQQMRAGSDVERLAQQFERLTQEQRALKAQTAALLPQTLGKSMSELSAAQRDQLQANAQQQQNLQKATAQALQELERAGNRTSSQNAEQSQAARQAAEDLKQGRVTEQQSGAAQNAQQNSLGQALSQQEQAARQLQAAAERLRDSLSNDPARALQQQLSSAMNRLSRMQQQQQDVMQQTRPSLNREQRQQLAEAEKELEHQARELARQLQRLQRRSPSAGKASESLSRAQQELGQSGESLSQGDEEKSQSAEQRAQQAMRQAMESLQQAMADAKGNPPDPFAKLRQALERIAGNQRQINEATRQAAGSAAAHSEELQRLSRQQAAVHSETQRLDPELPGEVFRRFSQEAQQAMGRSKDGLDRGDPGPDPTQQSQARALSILEQLKKALEPGRSDQDQNGGGGGGQGGQQGKPDPDLPKRIAEMRLLRAMEQGIRSLTRELDANRSERTTLTEAQKQQIEETAGRQGSARDLAQGLAEGLARHRNLAEKVGTAGRHMTDAHRGLAKQQTDDPIQESEEKAILQLDQALKQAEQQQRQQQQQQQRRREQQQQAGGQPQAGRQQPSGGQTQQQQGGPALRSLQRSANREDGPLAAFGSGPRGFGGLDPRSQDALRQGYREKIPPEYQSLINRYYKALSNRGGAR